MLHHLLHLITLFLLCMNSFSETLEFNCHSDQFPNAKATSSLSYVGCSFINHLKFFTKHHVNSNSKFWQNSFVYLFTYIQHQNIKSTAQILHRKLLMKFKAIVSLFELLLWFLENHQHFQFKHFLKRKCWLISKKKN